MTNRDQSREPHKGGWSTASLSVV